MERKSIAIVVVAYNRVNSLQRLLNSLNGVDFEGQCIPLIISIDYSGKNDIYDAAKSFVWKNGDKKVIQHSVNLGLKKHVLTCGDQLDIYDAIIVLEDDLIVSPAMYSYAWRAVERYYNDENIEAISLYGKIWNETAYKPFVPSISGWDTYFIQTAESWGQIWFKEKWKNFRKWYEKNKECSFESEKIPLNVCQWDNKSWKKYHIKYCIENNKYTVYPYEALTTCMGDVGEHTQSSTFISQVPIIMAGRKEYRFAPFESAEAVKYDAFLERVFIRNTDTCMDLYGQKKTFSNYKYVISSQILNYRVVESYGLALRPHEENIFQGIRGEDFYKYDLAFEEKNKRLKNRERLFEYYHYSSFSGATNMMIFSELYKALVHRIFKKVVRLFRRK